MEVTTHVLFLRNMQTNFIDRIKLPFRKEKELYLSLYRIIGFFPRDIQLYKTALLHKSITQRNDKGKPINNERLEFLGDSILSSVVSHIIFKHFPGKGEGFLSTTRSKLVQRDTLGKLSSEMGINNLILTNAQNNTHNSYIGGNAFEALLGAIYLDRGYEACMLFIKKRILNQIINLDKVAYKEVNFKSKLLEWTQKNRVRIEFRQISQKKDNNNSPIFNCLVLLEGVEGSSGLGYSKKESQQNAAKLTLEQLRKKPQFIEAVFDAKSNRTKNEEQPAVAVPKTDERDINFLTIEKGKDQITVKGKNQGAGREKGNGGMNVPVSEKKETGKLEEIKKVKVAVDDDEFDLSSITSRELNREEIIALAEEQAYS